MKILDWCVAEWRWRTDAASPSQAGWDFRVKVSADKLDPNGVIVFLLRA